jgi:hypothetical protein
MVVRRTSGRFARQGGPSLSNSAAKHGHQARWPNPASRLSVHALAPDDPEWLRLLGRRRHDFYAFPEYVSLEAQRMGGVPWAFAVQEGRDFLALPLVVRPIPGLAHAHDATSPYGYPGMLHGGTRGHDLGWQRRALAALVGDLPARGLASVFVRLHPLLPQPLEVLREFGEVVQHGETVAIELSRSEGELFDQMRLNHRRVIRWLRKEGVTARVDPTWARLDEFVKIYKEAMEALGASPSYFFPHDYFHGLRSRVGSALHMSVVEHRGELLSAGIFSECSGIVQYHLGATSQTARSLSPSRLMFHSMMEWAKSNGNGVIHLGGVGGRADSLFHFKVGFASGRATFATWRAIIDPELYRQVTRVRGKGPDLGTADEFFPPYRRGHS